MGPGTKQATVVNSAACVQEGMAMSHSFKEEAIVSRKHPVAVSMGSPYISAHFFITSPGFMRVQSQLTALQQVLLGTLYVLQRDDHPRLFQQRGMGWDRWGKMEIPGVLAPQGKAGFKGRQHSQLG